MGIFRSSCRYGFIAGFLAVCISSTQSFAASAGGDDRSLFDHAVQLSQQGEWSEAANLFRGIADRNPAWPEPKNNLAVAMLQMGQLDKAQQALEDAVSSLPSFRTAQDNRRRLYDYLAAQAYDRALGKNAGSELPKLALLTRIDVPTVAGEQSPTASETTTSPAVTPVAQSTTGNAVSVSIRQQLLGWSRAWSNANVEAYLANYSTGFKPQDATKDYTQWINIRRARLQLASNTQVTLHDIRVYVDEKNKQAIAEFVQIYRSDRYRDKVKKQLLMAYENQRWLILSERVIEQIN
jgi:tetratricopeptide (TPR) repeat protein